MVESRIQVRTLSPAERQRLGTGDPDVRENPALVVTGSERVLGAVQELLQGLSREEDQSEQILRVLTMGLSQVPDESRVVQIQRQAEARARYLEEFVTFTSQQLAELNHSKAQNVSALASRWKAAGKVFALDVGGVDRYPAFQFDDGFKPLPVVALVLEALSTQSPWGIALWFASNVGWLGGKRPLDLLKDRPDDVVEAARRTVEPLAV